MAQTHRTKRGEPAPKDTSQRRQRSQHTAPRAAQFALAKRRAQSHSPDAETFLKVSLSNENTETEKTCISTWKNNIWKPVQEETSNCRHNTRTDDAAFTFHFNSPGS